MTTGRALLVAGGVVAVAAIGAVLLGKRAAAAPTRSLGAPPPPPRPRPPGIVSVGGSGEAGVVDQAVETYDAIAEKGGYEVCKAAGGPDAVCKSGALKWANPVTWEVHAAKKVAGWLGIG